MRRISSLALAGAITILPAAHAALSVTDGLSDSALVSSIVGSGITSISNVQYRENGNLISSGITGSGTFSNGVASGIGIEEGLIMTTGFAKSAEGSNDSDGTSDGAGMDSASLKFDFTLVNGGDLFFNYVFASEEYNEYTNSQFNDLFTLTLDGTTNIALIPGTSTPVSVNNVNGGNPLGTGASNSAYYVNNDLNDGGPFFDIEYDGFTVPFTASALGLAAGTHTFEFFIEDTGDQQLDSAVFVQGSSFSDTPTDLMIPEPVSVLSLGLLLFAGISTRTRRSR